MTPTKSVFLIGLSAVLLAACGETEQKSAPETPAAPAAPAEGESLQDQAQQVVDAAMDQAAEMVDEAKEAAADALRLDASSLESFQSSLAAMTTSLDGEKASQLQDALTSLTKSAASDGDGMLAAASSMMDGGDAEATAFKLIGDKLDGLTADDIIAMAQ